MLRDEDMETIAPLVDYYKHIDKIRKIKEILFTTREVEIISCLINGRGVKKIASLLLMSPKTVEVHIRNVMLKIDCNSREKIIDFIESSENHLAIRKCYYFILERNH
jgi:DNA-binding NarL/FixJ family response regulator